MPLKRNVSRLLFFYLFISCSSPNHPPSSSSAPTIGFLDAFQDETIGEAKTGFLAALKEQGFDPEKNTLTLIYKNAQGNPATMSQEISYILGQEVKLIGTNTTLATIAAVQRTRNVPIFMMVAPSPKLAGLLDRHHQAPQNLFGVYETLNYIDTSIGLIRQLMPGVKVLGAIYSQSESQSAEAFHHLDSQCRAIGIRLIALPVNNSSETQLVVQSILSKHVDAFFALPDNSVFSSFETILQSCNRAGVPIFTSEEGLVKRGALAAFGPDIYAWGHQSGLAAARYLRSGSTRFMAPELVTLRRKVINPATAFRFHVDVPRGMTPILP